MLRCIIGEVLCGTEDGEDLGEPVKQEAEGVLLIVLEVRGCLKLFILLIYLVVQEDIGRIFQILHVFETRIEDLVL